MAKTQVSADTYSEPHSRLTFEQAKVQFFYGFNITDWHIMGERLSSNNDFIEYLKKHEESVGREKYYKLRWIAGRLEEYGRAEASHIHAKAFVAERKGTRPFLRLKDPFIDIDLQARELEPKNWDFLRHLKKLMVNSQIVVVPTIRIYYSGLGIVRLKTNFLTPQGRDSALSEIIYSADDHVGGPLADEKAALLIRNISKLLTSHDGELPENEMEACLSIVEDNDQKECIRQRVKSFAPQRTTVKDALEPEAIIDITNLDRGKSAKHKPLFSWEDSSNEQSLYSFFTHIINDLLGKPLGKVYKEVDQDLQRPGLDDQWYDKEGQHPYVSIFLPQYDDSHDNMTFDNLVDQFQSQLQLHRAQLARMLLRTSWKKVRTKWPPISDALDNVFYSDLVSINVHLRSTLCYYYLPTSSKGFEEFPELKTSYKYREELGLIIADQRLLWYSYMMFDHLVTEEIELYSKKFAELMKWVKSERFDEVLDGLSEIVQGIDKRKSALVHIMVDPQSRKGGSSLFTEIIERTTSCFHLTELYESLRNKLDRLDMLGIHIGEALHECSQLRVAEGTRSTQLTLEFLEAFIVGFYSAEVTHFIGLQAGEGHFPFPLDQWWVFYGIGIGGFLTTLPWLTMVRESFSHFKVKEPRWFELIVRGGSVVGPALLSVIIYLAINAGWDEKWIFPKSVFLLALFAAFILIVGSWWKILRYHRLDRSSHDKELLAD